MLYASLIIALLLGYNQSDEEHKIIEQSKRQASHYIQQIDNGIEEEANLWALSSLFESNPELKQFISRQVDSADFNKKALLAFSSKVGSDLNILQKIVYTCRYT